MIAGVVIVSHKLYKWLKVTTSETQITQLKRYKYSKAIVVVATIMVLLHLISDVG